MEEATKLLKLSIAKVYEPQVRKEITKALTQNQWDACVSFCYNCGSMKNLATKINNGTIQRQDWLKYVYAKGVKLKGLEKRRGMEADLFYEA